MKDYLRLLRTMPTPPRFCATRGEGPAQAKSTEGDGGTLRARAMGGYPSPRAQEDTPPPLVREGWGHPPSRRKFHAKHTFWHWNYGG